MKQAPSGSVTVPAATHVDDAAALAAGTTKLRPLGKHLVIRRDQAEDKIGHIYLADASKQEPRHGVVLAVGSKVVDVKAGDRVVFNQYAGTNVEHEGMTFMLAVEDDVLAIEDAD